MMKRVIVVADDLTGANDTGVQFAKRGFATEIIISAAMRYTWDDDWASVVVADTESRLLSATAAYRRVYEVLDTCALEDTVVYKKIDSTMRGNIGAEVRGALAAVGARYAFVAPAYPANGRTTEHGRCLVSGVPVSQTDTASDPHNPVTESDIGALIAAQGMGTIEYVAVGDTEWCRRPAFVAATRENPLVLVFDAANEDDLRMIWSWTHRYRSEAVYVGSAGLAEHIAVSGQPIPKGSGDPPPPALCEPVLLVIGSVNSRTLRQSAALPASVPRFTIELPTESRNTDGTKEVDAAVGAVTRLLSSQGVAVVRTLEDRKRYEERIAAIGSSAHVHGMARRMAVSVAAIVARTLADIPVGALFVTGGEIAVRVLEALGVSTIQIAGEVAPGVPWGRISVDGRTVTFITKAGGFGDDDILLRVIELLRTPR